MSITTPHPPASPHHRIAGHVASLIALVVALAGVVSGPAALAETIRVITGTVVLPEGVSPSDVEVQASVRVVDEETNVPGWAPVAEAPLSWSGSAWTYQLRVPAGTYVVGAVDFGPLAAPTWYPSAPSADEATSVVVQSSDVVVGTLNMQRFSSIGGVVVVAPDAPTRAVTVHAHRRAVDGTWTEEADAALDEDGAYRVLDLRAGTYRLELTYAGVTQSGGWYAGPGRVPAATRDAGVDVVLHSATDLDDVDVRMGKGAVVTGSVRNVAGKAVSSADIQVSAYEQWTDPWGVLRWRPVVTVRPNASGVYTLSGLPAGVYRFGAEDRRGQHFPIFHPGVGDVDRARSVTVTGGTTLRSINFILDTGTTVRGTVTVPSGIARTTVRVELMQKVGSAWVTKATTWVGADGKYSIAGVPAGSYRIGVAHDSSALSPWFYGKSGPVTTLGAASTVTVGTTRTLTINAVLSRRGTPIPKIKVVKKPTVSGKAKVGRTLKVTRGKYVPSGVTVKYRWYVKKNGKAVAIKGATKAKLKLKKSVRGRQVRVKVTVQHPTYRSVTVTSKWSRKVVR